MNGEIEARLQDAITEAVDASMVTSYLVIAACIDDTGSPYLADLSSPGMPYWDAIGLCQATAQSRAPQPMWTASERGTIIGEDDDQ